MNYIRVILFIMLFVLDICAQVNNEISKFSEESDFHSYVDSTSGFTFNYPSSFISITKGSSFTIKQNSDYYLFGRVFNIDRIINDNWYDIEAFKITEDIFKEVAVQATVTTRGISGDRGEAHFRVDSLREFYNENGLRIISVYFTIVTYVYDSGTYEEDYADPMHWVDISGHQGNYALRLDFRDYKKIVMKLFSQTVLSSLKLLKVK